MRIHSEEFVLFISPKKLSAIKCKKDPNKFSLGTLILIECQPHILG